jgi:hydrogenase expression/formation protein HypC
VIEARPDSRSTVCLSIPGKVIEVVDASGLRMGRVDFGGITRPVCLEHVDAIAGDWVLVHVGFALKKISHDEAVELAKLFAELGLDAFDGELEEST